MKRYTNVQLDGKSMKIEIVGTNVSTSAAFSATNDTFGNSNGSIRVAKEGVVLEAVALEGVVEKRFQLKMLMLI
ncbi:hypothetical protein V6N13_063374 [Hibiscus sabdariffa]|uniref:Uncharacterized protein n=1 Tax=Hibiscus sabdariffa TaxID=183260 RepID=A0ABR2C5C9_9ROSI